MTVGVTDEVWWYRKEEQRQTREEGGCGKRMEQSGIDRGMARRLHRRRKRRRHDQERRAYLAK